jgi:hypothetical protein
MISIHLLLLLQLLLSVYTNTASAGTLVPNNIRLCINTNTAYTTITIAATISALRIWGSSQCCYCSSYVVAIHVRTVQSHVYMQSTAFCDTALS